MGKKKEAEVFGQSGGLATVKKYGKKHMRQIALDRWERIKREKAKK